VQSCCGRWCPSRPEHLPSLQSTPSSLVPVARSLVPAAQSERLVSCCGAEVM
jgi:hypothetical protein